MGKGDRKTAKGKRYNASYGNARPNVAAKATGTTTAPVAKKAATKKARTKKAAAKADAPETNAGGDVVDGGRDA